MTETLLVHLLTRIYQDNYVPSLAGQGRFANLLLDLRTLPRIILVELDDIFVFKVSHTENACFNTQLHRHKEQSKPRILFPRKSPARPLRHHSVTTTE